MRAAKKTIALLGLALIALAAPTSAQAGFGIESYGVEAKNQDGTADFQAGSNPYEWTIRWTLNKGGGVPEGIMRDIVVELPPGMVGNPTSLPRCTRAQFEGQIPKCPGDTQVGVVRIKLGAGVPVEGPVFNLTPPNGVPGMVGFGVTGKNSFQEASLRSSGDYGLGISDLTVPQLPISSIEETIWGTPAAASHDPERQCQPGAGEIFTIHGCESDAPLVPFFTMPTSCGEPLETTLKIDSVEEPGVFDTQTVLSEEAGVPAGMAGCNAEQFEPSISSQPTTNLADSPTGLDFHLHVPQPPKIEAESGRAELCDVGSWSGSPTSFAIQWLRNGAPIPGETSPSHILETADEGTSLQCEVTAENAAGKGYAASAPLPIAPAPATAPPTPGKVKVGGSSPVTCNPGTWSGEPSFTYRWYKDGALVAGQTEPTYAPGPAPYTIQCEVIGTNAGGTVVAFSPNVASSSPAPAQALPANTLAPHAQLDPSEIPLATAHLKDTTVTLPEGLVLNPSVAGGLDACTEAQIGLIGTGFEAPNPIHFSKQPQSCPNAAKVGTLEVKTPLLNHKLPGAIYIAKPYENPFGSFMAIYLAIEDEETGTVVKLAGKVVPDPQTGQLTTTFENNPQLPVEDFELHFFAGTRAALKTPLACGTYTTTSSMVPWSTPEGQTTHPSDSFQTSVAAGGSGTCPGNEASATNSPSFSAGTVSPQAGAYSPFVLKLTRKDGTQRLKAIDLTLPKGLTGKLAGIPYCSEAGIGQAKSREAPNKGVLEQQHPSCPSASEVGTVTVGAGAGVTPYYTTGHAYLAGPYEGGPASIVIVTPAVAGPFDLGAVVVRTALHIDPETTQVRAVSDPIPSIIQGVPLDVRSIALTLGRPSFTLNPTSCEPTQVLGSATSLLGTGAALANPFQVGGCRALGFKPKLSLSLKGGTTRGKHPALKAVLSYPPGAGYANTASAQVTLPHSEFIDQSHFKTICTRVQFAAEACPAGSIYGYAKATTPLLEKPVEGPVYLRSSSHELPDLAIALRGQVNAVLVGRVDTGKSRGLRTTFEAAPDVPVSQVVLQMQGGKKGLLVNSENLCRKPQRALAYFTGQNGKAFEAKPLIKNGCRKAMPKHKKHRRH